MTHLAYIFARGRDARVLESAEDEATPPQLQAEATGNLGWIAGLDECVEGLERSWGIRVGESLLGGSESLVARAVCRDGTLAVMKVGLPDLARSMGTHRFRY